MHGTSLHSFGYGDVVHQFEKRCKAEGNKEQELELFFNNSSDFKTGLRQDLRKKTGFYSKSLFLTHTGLTHRHYMSVRTNARKPLHIAF
ncbi:MAG: hypothetical protein O4860_00790 [Trichodesmium sp. St2_bin2_1]|nr:hypothetical protein [Trichodesmium sp. St2_bin2_1]